jgi:pimeloyl-ACP methyl ester carboxylesterase
MAVSVPVPGTASDITFPFDRDALLKTLKAAEASCIRDWIPGILGHGIPILILRGETSQVWSASDYEEERARWIASPLIRFETFTDTGHGLPFEKRVQFLERLRQFMSHPPGTEMKA